MPYRQFDLATDTQRLTCWLVDDSRLTPRRRITLKGDDTIWRIVTRYKTVLDEPPLKEWRVGGLV